MIPPSSAALNLPTCQRWLELNGVTVKTLKLTPCLADEKHEACRHEEAESSDVLQHMQKRVNHDLFEEPSG